MQITNLKIISGKLSNIWQNCLSWENPSVGNFDEVRVVYKQVPGNQAASYPAHENDGTVQSFVASETFWVHTPPSEDQAILNDPNALTSIRYCYSVFVHNTDTNAWDAQVNINKVPSDPFLSGVPLALYVNDSMEAPLVGRTVQVVRVRGSLGIGTPSLTDNSGFVFFQGATSTPTDTALWLGDEVIITVEYPAGTQEFQKTISLDHTMILDEGYVAITASPVTVGNQLPAPPEIVLGEAGINVTPTTDTTPEFVWFHSVDPDNSPNEGRVDYAIEIDTDISFASANYKLFTSIGEPANFHYALSADRQTWLAFPANGLDSANTTWIKFTLPSGEELSEGVWKWRVRATDRTPAV